MCFLVAMGFDKELISKELKSHFEDDRPHAFKVALNEAAVRQGIPGIYNLLH